MNRHWERLDAGATLVTANTRLARDLKREYDLRSRKGGNACWSAGDILDWNAWLRRSWDRAVQCGSAPHSILLSPAQEQLIWEQIIRRDNANYGLLNLEATARAAARTFKLVCDWGAPLSDSIVSGFEDPAAFLRWLRAFQQKSQVEKWISSSQLASEFAVMAEAGKVELPETLLHAGFDEFTPAQQRVVLALEEAGCQVLKVIRPVGKVQSRVRLALPDSSAEIAAAASWAREKLAASPNARIGIVIPGLENRAPEVERAFEDALHPSACPWPHKGRPAFHISAGDPLSEAPVVASAFTALSIGIRPMALPDAGLLLRSPFLAGSETERGARALLDAEFRRRGFTEIDLSELLRLSCRVNSDGTARPYACAILARSLRAWDSALKRLPERQMPSGWSRAFSRLLGLSGWPGERTLSSHEYQATQRWNDLLSEFAALDLVGCEVSYRDALERLKSLAGQTRFAPADEHAPVQIMGVLESAGSVFDALWIMGLEDRTWPAPPRPDPFLPAPLQRKLGMPHSSAECELAFARTALARLLDSAPEMVASYPKREEDTDLRPSPLILELDEQEPAEAAPSVADLIHANPEPLEVFEDRSGPPVEPGTVSRGGTGILQRQAECPFGAFAQFRLFAKPLEEPEPGLSPLDRGTLVHAAMEHFWTEVRTRDTLAACTPERRTHLVRAAVEAAIARLRDRGAASAGRLIQLEKSRLERLVSAWLDVEAARGPFTVKRREEPGRIDAGGVLAEIRIDRIDELPDGREVIIDYKTSYCTPSNWEGERPDAPQLPLYAANRGPKVAGVLFAQMIPGKLQFKGLTERAGVGKEYSESSLGKAAGDSLADHIAEWRQTVNALGAQFREGAADPFPKNPGACTRCAYAALCRMADLETPLADEQETPDALCGGEQ